MPPSWRSIEAELKRRGDLTKEEWEQYRRAYFDDFVAPSEQYRSMPYTMQRDYEEAWMQKPEEEISGFVEGLGHGLKSGIHGLLTLPLAAGSAAARGIEGTTEALEEAARFLTGKETSKPVEHTYLEGLREQELNLIERTRPKGVPVGLAAGLGSSIGRVAPDIVSFVPYIAAARGLTNVATEVATGLARRAASRIGAAEAKKLALQRAAAIARARPYTSPAVTFGAAGAVPAYGEGKSPEEVMIEGALGAVAGLGFGALGQHAAKMTRGRHIATHAGGAAAIGAGQTLASGGSLEDVISSALTMGSLGAYSGHKGGRPSRKEAVDIIAERLKRENITDPAEAAKLLRGAELPSDVIEEAIDKNAGQPVVARGSDATQVPVSRMSVSDRSVAGRDVVESLPVEEQADFVDPFNRPVPVETRPEKPTLGLEEKPPKPPEDGKREHYPVIAHSEPNRRKMADLIAAQLGLGENGAPTLVAQMTRAELQGPDAMASFARNFLRRLNISERLRAIDTTKRGNALKLFGEVRQLITGDSVPPEGRGRRGLTHIDVLNRAAEILDFHYRRTRYGTAYDPRSSVAEMADLSSPEYAMHEAAHHLTTGELRELYRSVMSDPTAVAELENVARRRWYPTEAENVPSSPMELRKGYKEAGARQAETGELTERMDLGLEGFVELIRRRLMNEPFDRGVDPNRTEAPTANTIISRHLLRNPAGYKIDTIAKLFSEYRAQDPRIKDRGFVVVPEQRTRFQDLWSRFYTFMFASGDYVERHEAIMRMMYPDMFDRPGGLRRVADMYNYYDKTAPAVVEDMMFRIGIRDPINKDTVLSPALHQLLKDAGFRPEDINDVAVYLKSRAVMEWERRRHAAATERQSLNSDIVELGESTKAKREENIRRLREEIKELDAKARAASIFSVDERIAARHEWKYKKWLLRQEVKGRTPEIREAKKAIQEMRRRLALIESGRDIKVVFPESDLAHSRSVLERYKDRPEISRASDAVSTYLQGLITYGERAGLFDADKAIELRQLASEGIVPLYKYFEMMNIDIRGKGTGAPFREIQGGSGEPTLDPFVGIAQLTDRVVRNAAKSIMLNTYHDVVSTLPALRGLSGNKRKFASSIREIPVEEGERLGFNETDHTVTTLRNGKVVKYEMQPELFDAMQKAERWALPRWFDVFIGKPKRLTVMGATGIKVSFQMINYFRDTLTRAMQGVSAKGDLPPVDTRSWFGRILKRQEPRGSRVPRIGSAFHDSFRALQIILGMSDMWAHRSLGKKLTRTPITEEEKATYYRAMSSGLDMATYMGSSNIRSLVELRNRVAATTSRAQTAHRARHLAGTIKDLISFGELANRLAEYAKVEKEYAQQLGASLDDPRVVERAFASASDVTTNFRRMGTFGRVLNEMIPFFNPSIQGQDKFRRLLRDRPADAALIATTNITMPSLVAWWLNKDDADYQELQDWEKLLYIHSPVIPGINRRIKLPMPHEWGIVFGGLPVAMVDAMYRKDPNYVTQMLGSAINAMMPDMVVAGVGPVVENMMNRSIFRNTPIESEALKRLVMEERYLPHTPWMYKAISNMFGITSPVKWQHFFESITGGITRDIPVPAIGVVSGGRDEPLTPAIANTILRATPLKRFFQAPPTYGRSLGEFYDKLENMDQVYYTAKRMAQSGRMNDARELLEENSELLGVNSHDINFILQAGGDAEPPPALARMRAVQRALAEMRKDENIDPWESTLLARQAMGVR